MDNLSYEQKHKLLLIHALTSNSLELFKRLKPSQAQYAEISIKVVKVNFHPLEYVIKNNNYEFAEYLLKNYDIKGSYEPTRQALLTGNIEMLKLLMKYGLDISFHFDNNSFCEYICNVETIEFLMERKILSDDNIDRIIYLNIMERTNFKIIEYWLSKGYNFNKIYTYDSPLGLAIAYNKSKLVHYLCERGVDVNFNNPLLIAVRNDNAQKSLLILIKFKVNTDKLINDICYIPVLNILTTIFFLGFDINSRNIDENYYRYERREGKFLLNKLSMFRKYKVKAWLKDLMIKDLLTIVFEYVDDVIDTINENIIDECEKLYSEFCKTKEEIDNMKFYLTADEFLIK